MNTDSPPSKTPSGTADVAANVILDNGSLKRRKGFTEWAADVSGSALSVVSGHVASFAKGASVYAVCKCSSGMLYRRMIYPVLASGFTAISGGQTHSGEPGWWFMWDDALYHFDRKGGSKWNPTRNSGTAYEAGLPRPSVGPIPFAAAGGEMEGRYHVHVAYRNSRTREESVVSGTHTPYVETRLSESKGGITIDNWSTESIAAALARDGTVVAGGAINTKDTTHEWDQAVFYRTYGGTEFVGLGSGAEAFSYRGYVDQVKEKTDTSVGLNKSDECLDQRQPIVNTGGEPPAASVGCFTGSRAIFGNVFASACATLTTSQSARDADLTFEAIASGSGGNSITVQYTAGATAGSEIVAVATNAITVQIATGVSTASQVLTALQGSTDAMALITARLARGQSGAGVVTVNASPLSLSGGGTTGNSVTPGIVRYSVNGFPCMVPSRVTYSTGGDRKDFEPQPWVGESVTPCGGEFVTAAYGQGVAAFFTATAAYAVQTLGDGRLTLREVHPAKGASGDGAACGGARGVSALGDKSWLSMGQGVTRDLAEKAFSTTIEAIPAARRNLTRGCYYSFADQTWFACAKGTDNSARRVLVYDHQEAGGALVYFDLAAFTVTGVCSGSNYTGGKTTITATAAKFKAGMVGYTMTANGTDWTITDYTNTTTIKVSGDATALDAHTFSIDWDEGITGLCELAYPGATPSMLVMTNRGRVLQYPSGDTDDGKGYACQWKGYFAQERLASDQRVNRMDVHVGANCNGVVKLYWRGYQTAAATETQHGPVTCQQDNAVIGPRSYFDRLDANLYQLDIQSESSATAQWVVNDVTMNIEKRQ